VRIDGKLPERRSNHASFIYENLAANQRYLYVHGGRDLREGAIENMWRLDLDSLMRATEENFYPVNWEQIQFKGPKSPGRISHHKCSVQGDKMILIGGNRAGTDGSTQAETWVFDLKTN